MVSPLTSPVPTTVQAGSATVSSVPVPSRVAPSMYHARIAPLTRCRHTRSGFPSSLMSPVPTSSHSRSGSASRAPLAVRVTPSRYQTALAPVARLRQTRSASRSPLKSPVPTSAQFRSGSAGSHSVATCAIPPSSHTAFAPVAWLRHSKSGWRSPSISPATPGSRTVNVAARVVADPRLLANTRAILPAVVTGHRCEGVGRAGRAPDDRPRGTAIRADLPLHRRHGKTTCRGREYHRRSHVHRLVGWMRRDHWVHCAQ